MSVDSDATGRVSALNINLPPFWPSDPEVWFAQVEAQFCTRGITAQKTKFDYIIASLSLEYATEVQDIILHPPKTRLYDFLRKQLVKCTAISEKRRLQQLLTSEELGDHKPPQLLRRMQQLLGDRTIDADNALVRELFLQWLLTNIQVVLASTPDTTSLDELAQLADRITDAAPPATIAGITPGPPPQEVEQLRAEVTRLTGLVTSLTHNTSPRRHRSPTPHRRHRPSSPRRPLSPNERTLCWYHARFGNTARKCRPPCAMSGNSQAGH